MEGRDALTCRWAVGRRAGVSGKVAEVREEERERERAEGCGATADATRLEVLPHEFCAEPKP